MIIAIIKGDRKIASREFSRYCYYGQPPSTLITCIVVRRSQAVKYPTKKIHQKIYGKITLWNIEWSRGRRSVRLSAMKSQRHDNLCLDSILADSSSAINFQTKISTQKLWKAIIASISSIRSGCLLSLLILTPVPWINLSILATGHFHYGVIQAMASLLRDGLFSEITIRIIETRHIWYVNIEPSNGRKPICQTFPTSFPCIIIPISIDHHFVVMQWRTRKFAWA